MTPYKFNKGQRIATGAPGVSVDRAFLAHYHIDGLAAGSTTNILPFTKLGAAVQNGVLPAGDTPDVPRNVQVDANNSGVKKAVKVYGLNAAGDEIDETITTNETTAVAGTKAFAKITKIDLPVQHNAGAKHKATVAVTTSTTAGTSVLTFTSAATGAAYDITCTFSAEQAASTTAAAARIVAVLNADAKFAAAYTATAATANIVIERKVNENSDTTLNLTVDDNGEGDLALGTIALNTQAGVCDEVSVGWGTSIGIPYMLHSTSLVLLKLFDNAADNGTVTADAAELEKNVLALSGTPDGDKDVDLYIIA
jgi:hypothetical protein